MDDNDYGLTIGGLLLLVLIMISPLIVLVVMAGSSNGTTGWACEMKSNNTTEYCEIGRCSILFYGDEWEMECR